MAPILPSVWSRSFWVDAAERAGKTAAQTLLALWAGDGVNLLHVDWPTSLGLAGTAAVLSVLTSVASAGIGDAGTPSLVSSGRHTWS